MKLSIIIPVYNEKKFILKVIEKINGLKLYNNCTKEVIIVDDYSTDGTRDILNKIEKDKIELK